jgi:hypothetical protein
MNESLPATLSGCFVLFAASAWAQTVKLNWQASAPCVSFRRACPRWQV